MEPNEIDGVLFANLRRVRKLATKPLPCVKPIVALMVWNSPTDSLSDLIRWQLEDAKYEADTVSHDV